MLSVAVALHDYRKYIDICTHRLERVSSPFVYSLILKYDVQRSTCDCNFYLSFLRTRDWCECVKKKKQKNKKKKLLTVPPTDVSIAGANVKCVLCMCVGVGAHSAVSVGDVLVPVCYHFFFPLGFFKKNNLKLAPLATHARYAIQT